MAVSAGTMRLSVVENPESPVRLSAAPRADVAGRGIPGDGVVPGEHECARVMRSANSSTTTTM